MEYFPIFIILDFKFERDQRSTIFVKNTLSAVNISIVAYLYNKFTFNICFQKRFLVMYILLSVFNYNYCF